MTDLESKIKEKIRVIIPLASYQKLMAYVDLCKDEVSGFADVNYDSEKMAFVMGEVYLIEQESSAGDTEMDGDTLAQFQDELIKKGIEQLPRLWWHSHADMGTFWSGTDEATINDLKNDSFMIALETNHAHNFICSIVLSKPFAFRIDEVPVFIDYVLPVPPASLKKEVEQKVHYPVYTPPTYTFPEKKSKILYKFPSDMQKNKATVHYNTLPKSKAEALDKIEKLGLVVAWVDKFGFVFRDYEKNTVWIDAHDTFTDEELDEMFIGEGYQKVNVRE